MPRFNPFVTLKYPTFIARQLSYLDSVDWKIGEYDLLKKEFADRIGVFNFPTIELTKGSVVYRARFIDKQGLGNMYDINENDFFDNIRELGINTKERTSKFGRAHHPGNPVLYTALRPATAIYEMVQWDREQYEINEIMHNIAAKATNPGAADRLVQLISQNEFRSLVVSAWEVQEPLVFTYFFDKNLIPDEMKDFIDYTDVNIYPSEGKDKAVYESSMLIEEFFVKHFTKTHIRSNADYMVSALGAELVESIPKPIEGGKQSDGVLYASVAEGHKGVNCVINAEAVAAKKIKFIGAKCHGVLRPEKHALDERFPVEKFHMIFAEATLVSEETGDLVWKVFKTEGDGHDIH